MFQMNAHWRNALCLAALLACLAACAPSPKPTLRVGTNVWPGYEPLFLAADLGYFRDQPVRLVEHSAATEVLRAFRNGALDAAALTLDETLHLAQDNVPLRIVAVLDTSQGADAVLAREPIRDLREIEGKRIAVENTATGAYMLTRLLWRAGLKVTDIEVVPAPVIEHESIFLADRADMVVTFEPVRSRLIALGAHEIFTSADIPGEIVDVLVVREDVLNRDPRAIAALLRGWFGALKYLREHEDDALARLAPRERITQAQLRDMLGLLRIPDAAENMRMLDGSRPALLEPAQRLSATMARHRLLRREIAVAPLLSSYPLRILGAQER